MRPGSVAAPALHFSATLMLPPAAHALRHQEAHREDQEKQHERDVRQIRDCHGLASKLSVITSATLIFARLGKVSSTPRARRFPFSHVPFMLLSTIRKRPCDGSRRTRRCSRETSSLEYRATFTCTSSPPRPTLISSCVIK